MRIRGTLAAILGLVAFIAVLNSDILFAGRGFYQGDLTSYTYPLKHTVREVLLGGHFPSWDPHTGGGQPMAANPAYEIFYPPQWLILLPSYRFAFQLHIIVHFAIAGIGMLLLLRELGLRLFPSIFGAVAFILCGPYASVSSNLPILFSISWTPLILLAVKRYLDAPSGRGLATTSLLFAIQWILGEPSMPLLTILLALGYAAFRARADGEGWTPFRRLAVAAIGAFLLGAVQLIPAFDHARDSVRSKPFEYVIAENWSMPPSRTLELLVPSLFRHVRDANGAEAIATMYPYRTDAFIHDVYIGLFVVIVAISGLLVALPGRRWFVAAIAGSLALAFGGHTPLMRAIHAMPLLSVIRYPERFILGSAFIAIVWSAYVLDALIDDSRLRLRRAVTVAAALGGALAVILFLTSSDRAWFSWNLLRAAIAIIFALTVRRASQPRWQAALLAATAFDLWWAGRDATPRMPKEYFDPPAIVRDLPPPGDFRVYHEAKWEWFEQKPYASAAFNGKSADQFFLTFRNGLYPDLPAAFGYDIALAEDIGQTALYSTTKTLAIADELRGRDPAGHTALLRMMNVAAILRAAAPSTEKPVEVVRVPTWPRYAFAERIVHVDDPDAAKFHLNEALAQRTAIGSVEPFTPANGTVTVAEESPNRIRLNVMATGRALLMISVTGHKYWRATIDGTPAGIANINFSLQGLVMPGGSHAVELRYRNPLIVWGALVSALVAAALAILAITDRPTKII